MGTRLVGTRCAVGAHNSQCCGPLVTTNVPLTVNFFVSPTAGSHRFLKSLNLRPQNQWPHDWHGCVIGKPDIPFRVQTLPTLLNGSYPVVIPSFAAHQGAGRVEPSHLLLPLKLLKILKSGGKGSSTPTINNIIPHAVVLLHDCQKKMILFLHNPERIICYSSNDVVRAKNVIAPFVRFH